MTSSSRRERRPLDAEEEVLERQCPRAAHVRELDVRPLGEKRRQRVACGRPGAEIAADRPAVAYLRRADGAGRLCERRQPRGERRLHRLRVREARAQPKHAVHVGEAAELRELAEVEERVGPRVPEGELDQHVRPALDRPRLGMLRLQAERLLERRRPEDLHARKTTTRRPRCPQCGSCRSLVRHIPDFMPVRCRPRLLGRHERVGAGFAMPGRPRREAVEPLAGAA